MSICSTHSSASAPEATVSLNGYRFTTTSSKASMPSSSSAAACSGLRRSANNPACTFGCRVLTRPSSTSGKPVTSSTGVTGTPPAAMFLAVEPVETMSTPASCNPLAKSTSPVLSYTLINARRIGLSARSSYGCLSSAPVHSARCYRGQHVHQQLPFDNLDALVQRLFIIVSKHRYRLLRQDGPGIHSRVHQVHGGSGDPHTVSQRVGYRMCTGERRQQRGMGVQDSAREPRKELRPEDLHEARPRRPDAVHGRRWPR